jgi:hypothetical protein
VTSSIWCGGPSSTIVGVFVKVPCCRHALVFHSKCHPGNTTKLVSVRSSARIHTRELLRVLVKPDQVVLNGRNECFLTQGSERIPTQSATVLQGLDRQDWVLRWCRRDSRYIDRQWLRCFTISGLLVQRCGLPTCELRHDREHNILMRSLRRLTEYVGVQVLDAEMQIY